MLRSLALSGERDPMPNAKFEFYLRSAALERQHSDAADVGRAHVVLAAAYAVEHHTNGLESKVPEPRDTKPKPRVRR